jgi:tetratricopeptide (TPR) repeat protein
MTRSLSFVFVALLVLGCGKSGSAGNALPDTPALKKADEAWAKGDLARARSILDTALEKDSKSFAARYRLGVILIDDEPREAIKNLEQAAALEPEHPGPRLFLGLVRTSLSDFAAADRDMNAALRLAAARRGYSLPDTGKAAQHGIQAMRLEKYAEAMRDFHQALGRDSTQAVLWYLYGDAARRAGALAEAEHGADRALALRPDFPAAQVLHASILIDEDRIPEAQDVLTAVLAKRPAYAAALYDEGLCLEGSSQYRDALITYWHALLEDPTVPAHLLSPGRMLLRMQMPDQGAKFQQYFEWLHSFYQRKFAWGEAGRR